MKSDNDDFRDLVDKLFDYTSQQIIIRNIFAEILGDGDALFVGYIPNRACFCSVWVTKRMNYISSHICFWGQFSKEALDDGDDFGDLLFDKLPGTGFGNFYNVTINPPKNAGLFVKSHAIDSTDLDKIKNYLTNFCIVTDGKLRSHFMSQYLKMFFIVSASCNSLDEDFCTRTNERIVRLLAKTGIFSVETKFFV